MGIWSPLQTWAQSREVDQVSKRCVCHVYLIPRESSSGWRKDDDSARFLRLEPVLWVDMSALTLLVGWQEGHSAHKKPMPLLHKSSLPEQVEKELLLLLHPFNGFFQDNQVTKLAAER